MWVGRGWSPPPAARRSPTSPTTARGRVHEGGRSGVRRLSRGDLRRLGLLHPGGTAAAMRRFLRENGLSLAFGGLFLLTLAGQAVAGVADYNAQQATRELPGIGFWQYVTSSSYAADVTENWQSEYLQFFLYVVATVWLVQRGWSESKDVGEEGPQDDEQEQVGEHAGPDAPRAARAGGFRGLVYSRSLGL